MNRPETIKLQAIVINSIKTIEVTEGSTFRTYCLVDANSFDGKYINGLFVGTDMGAKLKELIGKLCDVTYANCIAGITEFVDSESIDNAVRKHTIDHKQVLDINKMSDINLLAYCSQHGLMEIYPMLKELNK